MRDESCSCTFRLNRRALMAGAIAAGLIRFDSRAQPASEAFGFPIGLEGRQPGDGFLIRHGFACENTWYNPGYWHTGEDWYSTEGDSAGSLIYAVGDGTVVYAGSNYPGLVIIVQHREKLFTMYGHLNFEIDVAVGQSVARGQRLGSVLLRTDGRVPSHLHFEARTFLMTPEVNGLAPRYGFACGPDCPPGPGYWPMNAPDHPSAIGWRNPTHAIGNRLLLDSPSVSPMQVEAVESSSAFLWSAPVGNPGAMNIDSIDFVRGDRFALLGADAGPEVSGGTSAEAYRLSYFIETTDRLTGWVAALFRDPIETGSDGRPSAVRFSFMPVANG